MSETPIEKPFPDSQCHGCRHVRITGSKRGSVFILCTEPSQPKYQSQPVKGCPAFAATTPTTRVGDEE